MRLVAAARRRADSGSERLLPLRLCRGVVLPTRCPPLAAYAGQWMSSSSCSGVSATPAAMWLRRSRPTTPSSGRLGSRGPRLEQRGDDLIDPPLGCPSRRSRVSQRAHRTGVDHRLIARAGHDDSVAVDRSLEIDQLVRAAAGPLEQVKLAAVQLPAGFKVAQDLCPQLRAGIAQTSGKGRPFSHSGPPRRSQTVESRTALPSVSRPRTVRTPLKELSPRPAPGIDIYAAHTALTRLTYGCRPRIT